MTPGGPPSAEGAGGWFRKKPVTVQAIRWFSNGDHPDDYADTPEGRERRENGWEGAVVRFFRRPEPEYAGDVLHEKCGHSWHEHGWIDTLEGGHTVCPGDWIITGVQGEHYPCKPDIFEATYEPAGATP